MKDNDLLDLDGRVVPFYPDLKCDICGRLGAYDFMGDYICPNCLADTEPYVEDNDDDEYTQWER